MVTLADVYSALEETNANVNIWQHPLCDATTIEISGKYDIFLNPDKNRTIADMKTKLIHEWGHCASGATHCVHSPYQLVAQNEHKANRYAYEKFLPFAEIKKAVRNGLTEYWQLAEYFNINEEFIRKAVHYYKDIKQLDFE